MAEGNGPALGIQPQRWTRQVQRQTYQQPKEVVSGPLGLEDAGTYLNQYPEQPNPDARKGKSSIFDTQVKVINKKEYEDRKEKLRSHNSATGSFFIALQTTDKTQIFEDKFRRTAAVVELEADASKRKNRKAAKKQESPTYTLELARKMWMEYNDPNDFRVKNLLEDILSPFALQHYVLLLNSLYNEGEKLVQECGEELQEILDKARREQVCDMHQHLASVAAQYISTKVENSPQSKRIELSKKLSAIQQDVFSTTPSSSPLLTSKTHTPHVELEPQSPPPLPPPRLAPYDDKPTKAQLCYGPRERGPKDIPSQKKLLKMGIDTKNPIEISEFLDALQVERGRITQAKLQKALFIATTKRGDEYTAAGTLLQENAPLSVFMHAAQEILQNESLARELNDKLEATNSLRVRSIIELLEKVSQGNFCDDETDLATLKLTEGDDYANVYKTSEVDGSDHPSVVRMKEHKSCFTEENREECAEFWVRKIVNEHPNYRLSLQEKAKEFLKQPIKGQLVKALGEETYEKVIRPELGKLDPKPKIRRKPGEMNKTVSTSTPVTPGASKVELRPHHFQVEVSETEDICLNHFTDMPSQGLEDLPEEPQAEVTLPSGITVKRSQVMTHVTTIPEESMTEFFKEFAENLEHAVVTPRGDEKGDALEMKRYDAALVKTIRQRAPIDFKEQTVTSEDLELGTPIKWAAKAYLNQRHLVTSIKKAGLKIDMPLICNCLERFNDKNILQKTPQGYWLDLPVRVKVAPAGSRDLPEDSQLDEEGLRIKHNYLNYVKPHLVELTTGKDREVSDKCQDLYQSVTSMHFHNPTTVALSPENRNKNRYANISCYDHHRVTVDKEDYRNASPLGFDGPDGDQFQFILTDAPSPQNPEVLHDQWKLIVQQKCPGVIILTKAREGTRIKMTEYWPLKEGEKVTYGRYTIEAKKINTIRNPKPWKTEETEVVGKLYKLEVTDNGTGKTYNKRLAHYLRWPDCRIPSSATDWLFFKDEAMKFMTGNRPHGENTGVPCEQRKEGQGPIVAHCSAGVGRSGTFTAMEHILHILKSEHATESELSDILRHVMINGRRQRDKFIQTEDQFKFLAQRTEELVIQELQKNANRPK